MVILLSWKENINIKKIVVFGAQRFNTISITGLFEKILPKNLLIVWNIMIISTTEYSFNIPEA